MNPWGGSARRTTAARAWLPVALVVLAAMAGCGDTSSAPAWVAAHPSTTLLAFETTAPGVCAITVQYPNDAPAAIGYLGNTYVQVSRSAHPAGQPGKELDHSGDWHILMLATGDLLLVTPGDAFDYRLEGNC